MVGLFAYLCFTVLAPWQLGKNTKTEHRNDLISNSINAETVPIGDVIADSTIAPDDEWRNITAAGTYLPDADILVRLQSIEGAPSYEILTPFRLDDGRTILVNRGYVRPINGAEAPPIAVPPTDPVTLNGRVRLSEGTAPGRVPMFEDGAKQVYSIDARPIGEFIGTDLIDAYIQLEPDQPGGLGTIPSPPTRCRPLPLVRVPVAGVRHHGAARTGLLHSRGVARTSQGEGSSSSCRRFRSGRRRYRDDPGSAGVRACLTPRRTGSYLQPSQEAGAGISAADGAGSQTCRSIRQYPLTPQLH